MLKKIFSKILGRKTEEKKEEEKKPKLLERLNQQSTKAIDFIEQSVKQGKEEYSAIREKLKDLHSTNYELGLKHLENGRLKDASIRFFLMRKFWPHDYDAYYHHAYCLILRHKNKAAQKILEELLQKNPNYDAKARELLEHIKQSS